MIGKSDRANFLVIYKTAKANGCFIFRKSTKKWYTPEEFNEDIPNIIQKGNKGETMNLASDFVIKSPFEALKFYNKWHKLVLDKILEIESKIDKDYHLEFKPKK